MQVPVVLLCADPGVRLGEQDGADDVGDGLESEGSGASYEGNVEHGGEPGEAD